MNALATVSPSLPAMSTQAVDMVRQLEVITKQCPQIPAQTEHVLHAGMYARTIRLPANVVLTGVLIKLETIVIVNGHCRALVGEGQSLELNGHHVLQGGANRKQVFRTYTETHITMLFPTTAQTIEQAENEFTDEAHLLMSRVKSGE